jgi:toxin HigB-1
MIITFADKKTEKLWHWKKNPKFGDVASRALRKLELLDAVPNLQELKKIPGLDLHPLKGDRQGQHAIKVNDQFRVCFIWGKDNNAYEVEVTDYH